MGDYEHSTIVTAPVDDLFDYLSRVQNLPRYMERMTEAHSITGDEVSVVARLDPQDVGGVDEQVVRGEAWFRIDADHLRLSWGSPGSHDYHGELEVAPAAEGSVVTVRLHTERDHDRIDEAIADTLANIRHIARNPTELRPDTDTA